MVESVSQSVISRSRPALYTPPPARRMVEARRGPAERDAAESLRTRVRKMKTSVEHAMATTHTPLPTTSTTTPNILSLP